MKIWLISVFICVLVWDSSFADYTVAVVEYNPLPGPTANTTLEENVENYIYHIGKAKLSDVRMIVFPEYGLTGLTENPENFAVPIPDVGKSNFTDEPYVIQKLSNAAINHNIYIVVNLLELSNSTNSSSVYFNTNLVFANNGTLVAKYRKINLFQEPHLTPGTETVTFATDFGVFGLMTCMDILYYTPSQSMLVDTGVTDVIYPAAWNSYLPFYMSLEVQVGYALANKVNLLASNLNSPTNGVGGSSIVSSDGTVLRRILTDNPASNLVYADVTLPPSPSRKFSLKSFDILDNNTRSDFANYKNLTDFQYDSYVYKLLDLSSENITEEICDGGFCCNFNILAFRNESNSSEVYRLVAFNGRTQFDNKQVGIKFCNLVACLNQDIASCGVRPPSSYTTTFRKITVWGNWEVTPEEFYRPSSLRGNLEPVYNTTYLESRTNETVGVSFGMERHYSNVVMFGLYVRSGVEYLHCSLALMAVSFFIQRLI